MLLHVKDTMNCCFKSVVIRTVDSDVVVLAVAHFQGLPNIEQLWIAFGTGNDSRYVLIHESGPVKHCKSLLYVSVVDLVYSSFSRAGEVTRWV